MFDPKERGMQLYGMFKMQAVVLLVLLKRLEVARLGTYLDQQLQQVRGEKIHRGDGRARETEAA